MLSPSSPTPPQILPCTQQENRPKWSVMIPVYNCAEFLPDTLLSVLAQQAPESNMQIEVVDDASTDADVAALVAQIGKGRIGYYRQPKNVGSLKNFETCLNRAKGHLVHLLHGDDKVRLGYYDKIETLFDAFPQAGAAFCRYAYINENNEFIVRGGNPAVQEGILQNWLPRIAERQRTQCCAVTVKRSTYEKLGGFYGVTYGEDWEMWTRIAANYPVAYTPEVLAEYRRHTGSISGRSFYDGQYMRDLKWVINTIQKIVPEEEKERVKNKAYHFYAHYAVTIGNRLWKLQRNKKIVRVQIREALNMHTDLSLYSKIAKLYFKMLINY